MAPRLGNIPRGLRQQQRRFLQYLRHAGHDNDIQALNAAVPANATIEIDNPRGDVSVAAGDGATVQVQAHEMAYASSDGDAGRIFQSETPHVTVSGSSVMVKSDGVDNGRINLTVTVPTSARVTINAAHGDVTAAGLGAGVRISAEHGDTHLSHDHRAG